MGEPRIRFARSSVRRSLLLPAAVAAGLVGLIALGFAVIGVDDVEVLATLFFAPVCIAALLGGRKVGYIAAGAMALAYLGLRVGDLGDSGALSVLVLVLARSASYGVVAWATPLLQERIPALGGSSPLPMEFRPNVRARRQEPVDAFSDGDRVDWSEPDLVPVGVPAAEAASSWQPQDEVWDPPQPAEPPPPAPYGADYGAEPPPPPSYGADYGAEPPAPAWDAWGQQLAEPEAVSEVQAPSWDAVPPPPMEPPLPPPPMSTEPPPPPPMSEPMPMEPVSAAPTEWSGDWQDGGWQDEAPAARSGRWDPYVPPAPTVPTGWVDDATVPLGDETIPLGYTGELFLPRDLREGAVDEYSGSSNGNGSSNGHGSGYGHENGGYDSHGGYGHDQHGGGDPAPTVPRQSGGGGGAGGIDPETRLWNAHFFRDRLTAARDDSRRLGTPFSVVMIQVPDEPFQPLPYRRQVAVLRELGHQFIQARMIDHLVHLPDGAQHWFAVVLPSADRAAAHLLERRLRAAISAYLRSRGLHMSEVQSASLTSPDDDDAMAAVWSSLLGSTPVS